MLVESTIPKERSSDPALNQETLYALGIARAQELSKTSWTDYNVHDPGVTMLELLCYALTDLSYRAKYPVKDLLASESDNRTEMELQFPFTARKILPNRPLTKLDYRKLLIDVAGVKNAWVQNGTVTYFADTIHGKLVSANPGGPGIKEVRLRGLYNVVLEYTDDNTSQEDKEKVRGNAETRLQASRNLCEDFVNWTEVGEQPFLLCAELELEADADTARVKAEILFQVQEYLSPTVTNYSLEEMLARVKSDGTSWTVDEIFDGPVLNCGFIDDDELAEAELRKEIYLSDVISIIMDIKGVTAVIHIVISPGGAGPLDNKWVVSIDANKKAVLDQTQSRLVFYKRTMPVTADKTAADQYLEELEEAARSKTETIIMPPYDLPVPLGQYRSPGEYYSLQNHFPALYGLSVFGLSGAADDSRKALAYQLKGYLLFFDQVLANYFAQLSHLKRLFSTDSTLDRTYYSQVVTSFANYLDIYRSAFVADDFIDLSSLTAKLKQHADALSLFIWDALSTALQQLLTDYGGAAGQDEPLKEALANELTSLINALPVYDSSRFAGISLSGETREVLDQNPREGKPLAWLNRLLLNDAWPGEIARYDAESSDTFTDRRNRFLDHLIARFAERFTDYVNILSSVFAASQQSLITYKCDFLKSYDETSADRSLAYNYSLQKAEALWNTGNQQTPAVIPNVSGLEKRLASLLGLTDFSRRNLADIALDIYAEIDSTPGDEFRWRIYERNTSKIILSSSTRYATPELARQEMQTALSLALVPSGYQRKLTSNNKYYFNIIDSTGEVVGRRIEYFETSETMEQEITKLMEYLRAHYPDEGMYLIESILLRPEKDDDPFLPICPDPNCTDCADEDPYSYRIHVILPAYSSRFSNMDFRRFVEEVIREETPAHILPRICWISKDEMGELEKVYRDWIFLEAGTAKGKRKKKLADFIEKLFDVRNVYPQQKLHECDSPEDQQKFLLDQTALGTMTEETNTP